MLGKSVDITTESGLRSNSTQLACGFGSDARLYLAAVELLPFEDVVDHPPRGPFAVGGLAVQVLVGEADQHPLQLARGGLEAVQDALGLSLGCADRVEGLCDMDSVLDLVGD